MRLKNTWFQDHKSKVDRAENSLPCIRLMDKNAIFVLIYTFICSCQASKLQNKVSRKKLIKIFTKKQEILV